MTEHGPQRRKSTDGRLLHCCCVCLKLECWGADWSCYASVKEMDDASPYPKFCSPECRAKGGSDAKDVTEDMKQIAKDNEWRDPKPELRGAGLLPVVVPIGQSQRFRRGSMRSDEDRSPMTAEDRGCPLEVTTNEEK